MSSELNKKSHRLHIIVIELHRVSKAERVAKFHSEVENWHRERLGSHRELELA